MTNRSAGRSREGVRPERRSICFSRDMARLHLRRVYVWLETIYCLLLVDRARHTLDRVPVVVERPAKAPASRSRPGLAVEKERRCSAVLQAPSGGARSDYSPSDLLKR